CSQRESSRNRLLLGLRAISLPAAHVAWTCPVAPVFTCMPLTIGDPGPTATDSPWNTTCTVPVTEEADAAVGSETTRGNDVGMPSGLPVTMIGKGHVGGEAKVLIVRVVEQVGLHAPGLNPAEAPVGRPEAAKETG